MTRRSDKYRELTRVPEYPGDRVGTLIWEERTIMPGESCGYDLLPKSPDGPLVEINLASGSDYSGDSVTVSNYRVLADEFADRLVLMYGSHGTYSLAYWAGDEEIEERLASLDDYPVLDEDDLSEVEREAEEEAWNTWLADDLAALIDPDDRLDWLSADAFSAAFWQWLYEDDNEHHVGYWLHETGNSAHIDLDRIMERLEATA
jgi:hypothetical protein